MKVRVWQYTHLDPKGIGGVESHIFHVSEELKKMGYVVFIGLKPSKEFLNQTDLPLFIHTHGESIPDRDFFKIKKSQKNSKHIHVSHGTTFGRTCKTMEFHKISSYRGAAKDFVSIHMADAVACVSEVALKETRQFYFSKKISRVIPNGVDEKIFYPMTELTSEPKILFVGRSTDKVKNLSLLLKAFSQLSAKNSNVKLVVVSGDRPSTFQNIINTGPKFGADLAEVYRNCRVLVIPSYYEGDSIVAREACAVGLPVLAVDLPVLHENLKNYEASSYFKFNDINSLSDSLEKILNLKKGDGGTFSNLKPTPKIRSWNQVAKDFELFYQTLNKVGQF